jgi:hypothetical protein
MSFRSELTALPGTLVLLLALTAVCAAPAARGTVVPLEAEAILLVDSARPVEPSGLCLRDGELYSVCDDDDATIFRLRRADPVVVFEPFLNFRAPPGHRGALDLEGIVAGPEGSFFLLSEATYRVLRVYPDGRSAWVTPSIGEAGRDLGFFRARGGDVEGLAALGPDRFLILAERQPRGWFEVGPTGLIAAKRMPGTRFPGELALTRLPDFTGADWSEGVLYTLFRGADMITTLQRNEEGWEEGPRAWSFARHTRDERWAYQDMRFGLAEGLAVDRERFYVILDNNRDARRADPTDRRPLLLILRRE